MTKDYTLIAELPVTVPDAPPEVRHFVSITMLRTADRQIRLSIAPASCKEGLMKVTLSRVCSLPLGVSMPRFVQSRWDAEVRALRPLPATILATAHATAQAAWPGCSVQADPIQVPA